MRKIALMTTGTVIYLLSISELFTTKENNQMTYIPFDQVECQLRKDRTKCLDAVTYTPIKDYICSGTGEGFYASSECEPLPI